MFFIKTTEQVFPHSCQPEDLKLTGYTPSSIRYHCVECGGMLSLAIQREDWEEFFGPEPNLQLTEAIIHKASPGSIKGQGKKEQEEAQVQPKASVPPIREEQEHIRWTPKVQDQNTV